MFRHTARSGAGGAFDGKDAHSLLPRPDIPRGHRLRRITPRQYALAAVMMLGARAASSSTSSSASVGLRSTTSISPGLEEIQERRALLLVCEPEQALRRIDKIASPGLFGVLDAVVPRVPRHRQVHWAHGIARHHVCSSQVEGDIGPHKHVESWDELQVWPICPYRTVLTQRRSERG
jgi:hypothetical protein